MVIASKRYIANVNSKMKKQTKKIIQKADEFRMVKNNMMNIVRNIAGKSQNPTHQETHKEWKDTCGDNCHFMNGVRLGREQGYKDCEKRILELIGKEDIYPTDIFPKLTSSQIHEINSTFIERFGFPVDRLSAHICRIIIENWKKEIRQLENKEELK